MAENDRGAHVTRRIHVERSSGGGSEGSGGGSGGGESQN